MSASAPASVKSVECTPALTALNEQERRLRGPECNERPGTLQGCLTRYGKLLSGLGSTVNLAAEREVMRCRTRVLGSDMCEVARSYLSSVPTDKGATSGTWHRYFAELVKRETTDKDCARFDQFNKLGWKPYVFRWTERDGYEAYHQRAAFFADPEYTSRWAPALERSDYGPPDRSVSVTVGLNASRHARTTAGKLAGRKLLAPGEVPFPAGSRFFQGGSLQMAYYLRAIYMSTGREVRELPLILEFGAGSAELVPVVRRLGFGGAFLVYDLPPMLLLQRYLQRYSGFSAHLVGPDLPPQLLNTSRRPGKGEPPGKGAAAAGAGAAGAGSAGAAGGSAARPRLLRNHTILVSSLHRTPDGGEYLPLALAGSGADLGSSLFYAAYSLTEAPPKVRDALRQTLRQFGLLFVTFTDIIQAFNNDKWMAGWVRDDLQGSHYVCSWKVPNREPDMATGSFRRTAYYMIAARKEGQSPVKCLEELGCNAKTKHKKLPLSC